MTNRNSLCCCKHSSFVLRKYNTAVVFLRTQTDRESDEETDEEADEETDNEIDCEIDRKLKRGTDKQSNRYISMYIQTNIHIKSDYLITLLFGSIVLLRTMPQFLAFSL